MDKESMINQVERTKKELEAISDGFAYWRDGEIKFLFDLKDKQKAKQTDDDLEAFVDVYNCYLDQSIKDEEKEKVARKDIDLKKALQTLKENKLILPVGMEDYFREKVKRWTYEIDQYGDFVTGKVYFHGYPTLKGFEPFVVLDMEKGIIHGEVGTNTYEKHVVYFVIEELETVLLSLLKFTKRCVF